LRILMLNDDGIMAPGIRCLAEELRKNGHHVIMVAPDRERSAASHSLSLRADIPVKKLGLDEYAVGGTPVDCAVIALQKLVTEPVDVVISGINAGQNMGEDVLYSGTVAAAAEASLLGNRTIAVSINAYHDQIYATAAIWMCKMLEMGIVGLAQPHQVLNINFPNVEVDAIKGIRLSRTGHRKYYNFIKIIHEMDDGFTYRIGGDLPVWDIEHGTDAEAVSEGYISITPLGFNLTCGEAFPQILEWLESHQLLQVKP